MERYLGTYASSHRVCEPVLTSTSSDLDHFSRPFLAQMIAHGLLDAQGWDGTFLSREWSVLGKEAQALGSDLNVSVTHTG
jgi:hypothetical protein